MERETDLNEGTIRNYSVYCDNHLVRKNKKVVLWYFSHNCFTYVLFCFKLFCRFGSEKTFGGYLYKRSGKITLKINVLQCINQSDKNSMKPFYADQYIDNTFLTF